MHPVRVASCVLRVRSVAGSGGRRRSDAELTLEQLAEALPTLGVRRARRRVGLEGGTPDADDRLRDLVRARPLAARARRAPPGLQRGAERRTLALFEARQRELEHVGE